MRSANNTLYESKTLRSDCLQSEHATIWDLKQGLLLQNKNWMIFADPFTTACATFFVKLCNTIPRQPIQLEICSNLFWIQQVL